MNPLLFLALLLKGSLFSTGGTSNLPILHDDLVPRGWATEREFAEALAIGQVSPGPNGLWVISFGYFVDGLRGSLFAWIAITLPPFLVLVIERAYRRVKHHPAVEGFVRGLGLAVVGIFAVVLYRMLSSVGLDWRSLGIAAVALALGLHRRTPVALVLAAGAAAGIALW